MGGPVRPRDTCCADEEWRPHRTVRRVEVSSCGRFRQAGRLLNEYRHKRGYLSVYLNDGKTRVLALSHREVLHAFAGPPSPERNSCNHKNGTKDDNHARNLEWTTPSRNTRHGFANGLIPSGERSCKAKLTWEEVGRMRRLYRSGVPQARLCERFGMSAPQVSRIVRYLSWRHPQ